MDKNFLIAIGIMTGNSLDGADLVATRYEADGTQSDIAVFSVATSETLKSGLRWVRQKINDSRGDVAAVAQGWARGCSTEAFNFDDVSEQYVLFVADAVKQLVSRVKEIENSQAVDIIGFHGQTCAHCPPSIAKSRDPHALYTVQIGDGQQLANLTGIPVVYDFRSDDLMNLGEGAPFAPVHHQHIARQIRLRGHFPIAFLNGGNTGNITIITENTADGAMTVVGWDTGPFNNFPDKLVQRERDLQCDEDGRFGLLGKVQPALLSRLFHHAVRTRDGENFLLKVPPRSSDPEWYEILPELAGEAPVEGVVLSFEDRLRTAEYFSAYIFFHTLGFVGEKSDMPCHFAVCGGGWKNPLILEHFRGLLKGNETLSPVLPEHRELFQQIRTRMAERASGPITCELSEWYGFDGTAMEARIFADAAVCRITREPFTLPETTGVTQPTVAGILRFPGGNVEAASPLLRSWIEKYNSIGSASDKPECFDGRWSRAAAGWFDRFTLSKHQGEH